MVDRQEQGFAGRLDFEETARRIASCAGKRGPNIDYLANTVAHLDDMGIREGHLHRLLRRATQLRSGG